MKELKISATLDELETMILFILNSIKDLDIDKKINGKLRLVSEEALVNIINYAYPQGDGDITIKTEITEDKKLTIQLIDSGIPFNPLEKEDPDIDLPMEDRKIGGLGIFMVKTIMDSLEYKYENGNNILILTKQL